MYSTDKRIGSRNTADGTHTQGKIPGGGGGECTQVPAIAETDLARNTNTQKKQHREAWPRAIASNGEISRRGHYTNPAQKH